MAPPVGGGPVASAPDQGIYNWHDVPVGQHVSVNRAIFDQGGYQILAATGETIVVPFDNQNLYVLKFGRSYGPDMYFVNEGDAPVLYLRNGDYLENAAAQNARWYPLPQDYNYTRPIFVSLAPSWNDYVNMGWYPGMVTYGGMWGYRPYGASFVWMPGFSIHIGGARYRDYVSYRTYYNRTPGYVRTRVVYNNYAAPRGTGSFGRGRVSNSFSSGSTGSFRSNGGTGSFGTGGTSSSRSRRTFGSSGFGTSPSTGSFGSPRAPSGSSFGGSPGYNGGSGRRSRSSFGSGGGSSFGSGGSSGGGSFRRRRF
jgi:hypothetical protein